ncbi:MAG: ABC transporter permease [Gammaproteobacteria bacterium]|jgi:ABC-type antimicrobial peptide transport system permease subunit
MANADIYKDVFEQAVLSLKDNKLRSILSILGIAVGIGAVMAVGSVTEGIRAYVYDELESYGIRTIWVYRDPEETRDPNRAVRQGSGITTEDYEFLRASKASCCPAVKRVTPQVYWAEQKPVRVGNEMYLPNVEGVGVEYLEINNDKLAAGRNFTNNDIERRHPIAIIGATAAEDMYGRASPIGKTFRYFDKKYTIVGVLEKKSRDIIEQVNADSYDPNKRLLITFSDFQSILGSKDVHTLLGEAYSLEGTIDAMKQVKSVLERRHGDRYKYKSENMQGWIDNADNYINKMRITGLSFAALALFVGGMGIMNIMSTSVIERTREIGIRKALGAQYKDIRFQFLMEATAVSTIGGGIGLVIGIIATLLIGYFSGYAFFPSWIIAILAITVSAIVGMMSGFFPARHAAKLNPVDALRHE